MARRGRDDDPADHEDAPSPKRTRRSQYCPICGRHYPSLNSHNSREHQEMVRVKYRHRATEYEVPRNPRTRCFHCIRCSEKFREPHKLQDHAKKDCGGFALVRTSSAARSTASGSSAIRPTEEGETDSSDEEEYADSDSPALTELDETFTDAVDDRIADEIDDEPAGEDGDEPVGEDGDKPAEEDASGSSPIQPTEEGETDNSDEDVDSPALSEIDERLAYEVDDGNVDQANDASAEEDDDDSAAEDENDSAEEDENDSAEEVGVDPAEEDDVDSAEEDDDDSAEEDGVGSANRRQKIQAEGEAVEEAVVPDHQAPNHEHANGGNPPSCIEARQERDETVREPIRPPGACRLGPIDPSSLDPNSLKTATMGNISMIPELNSPHNHRPLDRQNIPRPIRAHLWPGVRLFPDVHNGPAQGQAPHLVPATVLSQGNNLHPQAAIAPSQAQASGLLSAAMLSQGDILHPQAALAPSQRQSSGLRAPAALLQGDVFYQRDSGVPLLQGQFFHPGAQAVSFQGHARNLPAPPDPQDPNVDSVSTSLSELSMIADSRRYAAMAGNRETPVPQAGPSTYRRDREPPTPSNAQGEQNTPRYSHPSAASVSQSPVRSASQRSYTGRSQTRDPTPASVASEHGPYPDIHRFLRDSFAGIRSDPPPHFARAFIDIGVTDDLRLDLFASSDPQAGDWGHLEQALLRGDRANHILWLAVKKGLKERAERIMLGRRR